MTRARPDATHDGIVVESSAYPPEWSPTPPASTGSGIWMLALLLAAILLTLGAARP